MEGGGRRKIIICRMGHDMGEENAEELEATVECEVFELLI